MEKIQLKLPGLRIIKTAIAVFCCFIIAILRGHTDSVFYSVIAAIICLRSDMKTALSSGLSRMLGTFIGGFVGLLWLYAELGRWLSIYPVANYFCMSLVVVFLIWLISTIRQPNSATITVVVFFSIVLNHGNDINPLLFAYNRVVETIIGVVLAVVLNWIPFLRKDYPRKHF